MKALTILGSTGSIGRNALDLVERYPQQFKVVALAAGHNVDELVKQIQKFKPLRASVASPKELEAVKKQLPSSIKTELLCGESGLNEVARSPEAALVISAIVGFAGVVPTMAAIDAGKDIALANKEAIVASGALFLKKVRQKKVRLLPVDSEHSAIHQALQGNHSGLKRLVLTASGGPFLNRADLTDVKPEEALKHPTWSMGAKITIDSATMMNKGLEVIEATRLFEVSADQVSIVIHPESIIHSMVEYIDGSMLAQLGITDMRGPLAYAMAYPQRLAEVLPSLSLAKVGKLNFFEPDFDKFPCLKLAYSAARDGGSMATVLNAANEVAVNAFLKERLGYLEIPRLIAKVMERHTSQLPTSIEEVVEVDAWARQTANQLLP